MAKRKADTIALEYVGNGRFIIGVPAADLTVAQLDDLDVTKEDLINSGIYVEPAAKAPAKAKKEDK